MREDEEYKAKEKEQQKVSRAKMREDEEYKTKGNEQQKVFVAKL